MLMYKMKIYAILSFVSLFSISIVAGGLDQHEQLREAIREKDIAKVKQLIDAGAKINIPFDNGWTALHQAMTVGDTDVIKDIIKLLIRKGAHVNAQTERSGQTSLMMATQIGDKDIVQILLNAGADVTLKDKNGLSAMDHAKLQDKREIGRMLVEAFLRQKKIKEPSRKALKEHIPQPIIDEILSYLHQP
jgi:ankyrin repeat protein